MIVLRTLNGVSIDVIHAVFLDAFSRYPVPMNVTAEQLAGTFGRRGVDFGLSVGAFSGDSLVGFILNAKRMWNGHPTLYNGGTGVVQAFQRTGIARGMIEETMRIALEEGAEAALLEVITTNEPAVSLYRSAGFETTRILSLYTLDTRAPGFGRAVSGAEAGNGAGDRETAGRTGGNADGGAVGERPGGGVKAGGNAAGGSDLRQTVSIDVVPFNDLSPIPAASWWDRPPSWQNSTDSVIADRSSLRFYEAFAEGGCAGYLVLDPDHGSVLQIGVAPEYRHGGIATALVLAAGGSVPDGLLRFVNVDEENRSLVGFITGNGGEKGLSQFEMIRQLPGSP